MITDALGGYAMDFNADRLGLSHQCVFNMCHKILLTLQDVMVSNPATLARVSE